MPWTLGFLNCWACGGGRWHFQPSLDTQSNQSTSCGDREQARVAKVGLGERYRSICPRVDVGWREEGK